MRIEPFRTVADLGEEWAALAEASENVFATPEFHDLWLAREAHVTTRFAAVHGDDGDVRAILPLVLRRRGPLRILRFAGHGAGDELGPICAPDDRLLAVAALRELLAAGGFDVFVGEQLPPWAGEVGGRVLSREGSPVVALDGRSWDELLAERSRNFRDQVRRRERKLAREHELRYRLADAETFGDDVDTLFRLHRARWAGAETTFGAREAFFRELAAAEQARGRLRLWLLELDGAPVAAWLGFRFARVESYYQLGRDPAWDGASVGFVLLAHTVREAAGDGMREYRFLRGDESYKYRFADSDPGLVTVGVGRGILGKAGLSGAAATRRARRLLERGRSPS